jgi:hypothetical protein
MLDQLLQLPNGAHFYRADLHNHTPADPAFHCGGWPVENILEGGREAFKMRLTKYGINDG